MSSYYNWGDMMDAAQDAQWLQSLYHRKSYRVGSGTRYDNPYDFEVDQEGFVQIFTDGACFRNGNRDDAQAGIGVFFADGHEMNVREPLYYQQDLVTNNVAEIKAVVAALCIAKNCGVQRVEILTDSEYVIKSINMYIFKWLRNGWINVKGQTVVHRELFRELLKAMENMDLKWTHVEKRCRIYGNVMADKLAKEGAMGF